MAGWSDLFESGSDDLPRHAFLAVGEISSLVLDEVAVKMKQYSAVIKVRAAQDMYYSLSGTGTRVAYVLNDPTPEVLDAAANLLKQNTGEAFYFLISKEPSHYPKESFDYVKKKAQQSKQYYTISAPKSDAAKDKMVGYFLMRWGVTRDTSQMVCSILGYSPGMLYQFDKQFMLCTGGNILPSTQTQRIVEELLGTDTPSLIVHHIVTQKPVDLDFSPEMSSRVLNLLHSVLMDARLVQGAMSTGATSVSAVSKDTKLSQFKVLQAWSLAEAYSTMELRNNEKILLWAMDNEGNPDVLSVVSHVWGKL